MSHVYNSLGGKITYDFVGCLWALTFAIILGPYRWRKWSDKDISSYTCKSHIDLGLDVGDVLTFKTHIL